MPILKRLLSYCLALALFAVAGAAGAEQKTAVVDTQRVVLETEDGRRVQAKLNKLFEVRHQELERTQNDLNKQSLDLEQQKGVLSQAVLAQRTEKLQKEEAAVQQRLVEYNRAFQRKQDEMTQNILTKVIQIVRQLAIKEGFTLVVEKQTAIYLEASLDLTDRAIKLYNEGATSAKPPTPAKK